MKRLINWDQFEHYIANTISTKRTLTAFIYDEELVALSSSAILSLSEMMRIEHEMLRKFCEKELNFSSHSKGEKWLLGEELCFRAGARGLEGKIIDIQRLNQVNELDLAGSLVFAKHNYATRPKIAQTLPLANYLQAVDFGTLQDRLVTPYLDRGMMMSDYWDEGIVMVYATKERIFGTLG